MTESPDTQPSADKLAPLYCALATAQGAFQPIEKNRSVTIRPSEGAPYSFRYADLEEILVKTRPALTANGLALFQVIDTQPNTAMLRCELVHKDGGRLVSEISIPHPHTLKDPKQFGASVSYFRRYMVTAMLGVAADDDLDEDGAEMKTDTQPAAPAKPAIATPRAKAESAQPAEQRTPAPAAKGVNAGQIKWIEQKCTALGLDMQTVLTENGIESKDTITPEQFDSVKAHLLAQG